MLRVNGKIKATAVCVVEAAGEKLGIMPLAEALKLAQSQNLDLVEIDSAANPPLCKIIDFGLYRYELAKKGKKNT